VKVERDAHGGGSGRIWVLEGGKRKGNRQRKGMIGLFNEMNNRNHDLKSAPAS